MMTAEYYVDMTTTNFNLIRKSGSDFCMVRIGINKMNVQSSESRFWFSDYSRPSQFVGSCEYYVFL